MLITDVLHDRTQTGRNGAAQEYKDPPAEDPFMKKTTMMATGYALGFGGGADSSGLSENNKYNKQDEESPRQSDSRHSVGARTDGGSEKGVERLSVTPPSEREPPKRIEESVEQPPQKEPSETSYSKGLNKEEEEKERSMREEEVDGRRGEKTKKGILDTYTTNRLLQAIKKKIF